MTQPLTPHTVNHLCAQLAAAQYQPHVALLETILKARQFTYRPKDLHYWAETWRLAHYPEPEDLNYHSDFQNPQWQQLRVVQQLDPDLFF